MNEEEKKQINLVNLVIFISVIIFSFVAMILVFTTDFGWFWYGGGYSTYYFWIGSETAPIWIQIFLVILGLIFLILTLYAVLLLLLQLGIIKINISTKLQAFFGIGTAVIAFVYNAILVGLFAIAVIGADWGLSTSFFSSLIGSIFIGVLYIIYLVNVRKEESTIPAK